VALQCEEDSETEGPQDLHQYSEKGFQRKGYLTEHEQTHSCEKPFKYHYCEKVVC
jgi:hypothetical protein